MKLNGDHIISGELVIDTGDGKVVIRDTTDLLGGDQPIIEFFRKEGDANPSVAISTYAGAPTIGLGPGGASAIDTAIIRAAAGDITSRGDGLGAFAGGVRLGVNPQVGTSYTIAVDDRSKIVTRTNGSASTQSWPSDSAVAIPVGSFTFVLNEGAGTITHSAGSGASLAAGSSTIQKQGQLLVGFKTDEDVWWLWSPDHNHDAAYSAIGHDHDSDYSAISHASTHATGGGDAITPGDIDAVEALTTGAALWIGTQSAYDALGSWDSTTVYVVEG